MGFAIRALLVILGIYATFLPTCWASDESNAEASAPVSESAPAEVNTTAFLVVLNNSGPTLFASNQEITDNGKDIASLPRLTYKKIAIESGAHEFRFKAFPGGPRVAKLVAEPDVTYYLLAAYSPGRSWGFPFGGDPMTIKVIPESEALELLKDMKEQ